MPKRDPKQVNLNKSKKVILDAKNIGIQFGGLKAVQDFNFVVYENEIVGLIGPNGAGKTTTFNILTGVYQPTEGDVFIDGQSILGLKPNQIVKKGLARTFQNIRLFEDLSVIDNVKIAYNKNMTYGMFSAIFKTKKYWEEEKIADIKVREMLEIFDMGNLANVTAKNLAYGQQRKLEIARALATEPKILMLDEPAAGMNPQETQELMKSIQTIKDEFKISVLLIEHDMNLVMGICEDLVVLNYGVPLARGNPEEIKNNPEVIKAYLGE